MRIYHVRAVRATNVHESVHLHVCIVVVVVVVVIQICDASQRHDTAVFVAIDVVVVNVRALCTKPVALRRE